MARISELARLAQLEADEQSRFETQLAKTHLPADALNLVQAAMTQGHGEAVALHEALEGHSVALAEASTVALSEAGESLVPPMPAAVSNVDLSDMVMLPRSEFRQLIEAVASSDKPPVMLRETQLAPGKPGTGEKDFATQLAEATPEEAVKLVDAAQAEADKQGMTLEEYQARGK